MKIEKVEIEENEIVTQITKKSKAYWGYSKEQIENWNINLTITEEYLKVNCAYKLVIENIIVGYYSYIKKDNENVKLDNLFILPHYIGKGFGKILMTDFINRMKKQKIKKIILDSEPNAEKFYQKLGFKKIGEFETSIKNRFMPIMLMKIKTN